MAQVVNPQIAIEANTKIAFANIPLKGAAASQWYMLVQPGSAPDTWDAFKVAAQNEFITR